ncbi:catechol 1,2-dioxygenase [Sphingomonas histidinilytica]|jgi:catechol 1,2-dioxygenase|uniref:catechol 1,2-dioxygenase n=1 Tax=Rhizorhabdus histidinilytica TaxID=439228 RepID=A0A1T5BKQ6_9SPHN|nr:catechol 1,2-dioxygenase [Rhizorhabdus histidinilytica]MBO9377369.1 catechol 1,2-dioxygenase [Rhizorhabdus histidinilytica]QEH77578.1 catechol 1,2-dioxygenase [Sphingomonas sp. C8-2]SKB47403.1 catechol 1,2-dioxygenase [Rhizorhabdus histidinilytica]
MASELVQSPEIQAYLDRISGLDQPGGDQRMKQILRRIVSDLFTTIDDFDVSAEEFWAALHFMQQGAPEFGLIAPGLGFDHFLDVRMDIADKKAGTTGGTPRTIEGPLYIPGAPIEKGRARLDDGEDTGEVLIMRGTVKDLDGKPIAGAIVDVWHANTKGGYSGFDPSQKPYNNRRRIETAADGSYVFRSVVPSGYSVPPQGSTDRLLQSVGRHGNRPAHIHFFVSAPGYRHLTTQINIDGDPYLHDDFAFATHNDLIPEVVRQEDPEQIRAEQLNGPFSQIDFDFTLQKAADAADTEVMARNRAPAPAGA